MTRDTSWEPNNRPYEPKDIQRRTFAFAVRTLKVVDKLPKTISGQVVGRQLARSGTSIGANVEEAQGAQSKAEFARRMSIARSESHEAGYWLRLTIATELLPEQQLGSLLQESQEITRVLVAIVKKARHRQQDQARIRTV